MNVETLRAYCLDKPGAEETLPFGPDTVVYKVGGKAFLLTGFDSEDLRFNVKCDPDKAVELREEFACVLPGFHMNKKHWNTLAMDHSLTDKFILQQVDHSYEMVVAGLPVKVRNELQLY